MDPEQQNQDAPEKTESSAPDTAALEKEARGMGWRPKESFRGDAAHWVDAETYVRRGREFIPLLRAENGNLKEDLAKTKQEQQALAAALKEATESIEALKEYQSEATKAAVKAAKADLVKQLRDAREADDVDREMEILASISDLDAAAKDAKAKPKTETKPVAKEEPKVDPAFLEWVKDNTWWNTDRRRRGLAMGIADELRSDRANDHLEGRAFFDRVAEEVELALGERRVGKTEGGRPSGASGSASSKKGRSFADLPADAKEACEKMSKRLVGEGKAFKDMAAWQTHYTQQYFQGEEA